MEGRRLDPWLFAVFLAVVPAILGPYKGWHMVLPKAGVVGLRGHAEIMKLKNKNSKMSPMCTDDILKSLFLFPNVLQPCAEA